MVHKKILIEFTKFLEGWDMNGRDPESVVDEFLNGYREDDPKEYNVTFFLINILRYLSIDDRLRLVDQLSERLNGRCTCKEPDYELGYSYCHVCRKHLTEQRLDELEEIEEMEFLNWYINQKTPK